MKNNEQLVYTKIGEELSLLTEEEKWFYSVKNRYIELISMISDTHLDNDSNE